MEESTAFVGRDRELLELPNRLAAVRLLTVTGPPGCGKSRLALRLVGEMGPDHADGVVVAALGDLSGPEHVLQTVATSAGAGEEPGVAPADTLRSAIADRRILLVLDGCERVLSAVRELVATLLGSCPHMRVLATSRTPLGVAGEAEWPLEPLPLPDAVRLFAGRARVLRPGFTLDEQNAAAVNEICRRLDGIPLAIELAAARVKALSVQQIASRLDERIRRVDPSERASQAAVDWTYELLPEPAKGSLRALSMFPSGATLDALAAVTSSDDHDLLDHVTELIDRALVHVTEHLGEARYRMLESVRAHASERLDESGERPALTAAFEAWAMDLASRAEPELSGAGQAAWLDRLEVEIENLRAMLRSSPPTKALRVAGSLWKFWHVRGHLTEGREWLERTLERCEQCSADDRLKALNGAGALAWAQGDYETSVSHHERALELARATGDERIVAATLNNLGSVAQQRTDFARAEDWFSQSARAFAAAGDEKNASLVLLNLGAVAHGKGDRDRARTMWEDALAGLNRTGFKEGVAHALNNLASLAVEREDVPEARRRWNEALAIFRELGSRQGVAQVLHNLAMVAAPGESPGLYRESLRMYAAARDRVGVAWCLEGLAQLAGDGAAAARLLGAAEALRSDAGSPVPPPFRSRYESTVDAARARAGEGAFEAAWTAGRSLSFDDAVAEALLSDGGRASPREPATEENVFRREGEYWTIGFRGRRLRLKDAKGLAYIAGLLARPHDELHVLELAVVTDAERDRPGDPALRPGTGDAGEVFDAQAEAAYRGRLVALERDADTARRMGEDERAATLQSEIDALDRELARGVGLGGRRRKVASSAERARLNVTRAIRSAIDRIAAQDGELGSHLREAIRTGTYCSYVPDPRAPASWTF